MFPSGIIDFFQIKQDCNNVLPISKFFTNPSLQSNELICSAPLFPKTTLQITYYIIGFKVIYKSTINHSLHCLTQATCKSNGAIAVGIGIFFIRFWTRYDNSLLPLSRKFSAYPNIV